MTSYKLRLRKVVWGWGFNWRVWQIRRGFAPMPVTTIALGPLVVNLIYTYER